MESRLNPVGTGAVGTNGVKLGADALNLDNGCATTAGTSSLNDGRLELTYEEPELAVVPLSVSRSIFEEWSFDESMLNLGVVSSPELHVLSFLGDC